MPGPYYDLDKHKSIKNNPKRRRLLIGVLILVILILGAMSYFFWQNSKGTNDPIVVQAPTKSYYNGSPEYVIQNDIFSFKSTQNWQFSPEESSLNKYVYLSQDNGLIVYEFDVYANRTPADQGVNYVLPVTVDNNRIKAGVMSGRCGDLISKTNPGARVLSLQYQGTSFVCTAVGSGERAGAALVGGSYTIPLANSKGQKTNFEFTFVNDSSSAFAQIFQEILNTFQLK